MHNCPTCGAFPVPESRPVDGRSALECASRSAVDIIATRSAPQPPVGLTGLVDLSHKEISRLGEILETLETILGPICRPDTSQCKEVPCQIPANTDLEYKAADLAQRISMVCDRVCTLRSRISL